MSVIGQAVSAGGGTDTSDATASANEILSGYTAYVNDVKITGAIISKSAATYTPTTSAQTIASGQYLSGSQTIQGDANLVAGNILYGKSIFGVSGTLRKAGSYLQYVSTNGYASFYCKNSSGGYSCYRLAVSGHGFTPYVAVMMYGGNICQGGYGTSGCFIVNGLGREFNLGVSGYAGSFTSSYIAVPSNYSGSHRFQFAGYY